VRLVVVVVAVAAAGMLFRFSRRELKERYLPGNKMKRGGDTDIENDAKKPRMDAQDDFHESRKRFAKELPQLGKDDDGYIEGKVFMIWPPRNKSHRLNLEMVEGSGTYRFEVEVPHRDGITFRAHQRICLALRGARTERRKESSSPHYLPIILKYPDGVMLKYLNGVNQGKVVNTWEGGCMLFIVN
jgi:hypothetical protein